MFSGRTPSRLPSLSSTHSASSSDSSYSCSSYVPGSRAKAPTRQIANPERRRRSRSSSSVDSDLSYHLDTRQDRPRTGFVLDAILRPWIVDSEPLPTIDKSRPDSTVKLSKPARRPAGARSSPRSYSPKVPVPKQQQPLLEDDVLDSYLDGTSTLLNSDSGTEMAAYERLSYYFPSPSHLDTAFEETFNLLLPQSKIPSPRSHFQHSPIDSVIPIKPSPPSPVSADGVIRDTITIKAFVTEDSIVSFRAHVGISYRNLRRRLYDKFAIQEGVPISSTFEIVRCTTVAPPGLSTSKQSSSVSQICGRPLPLGEIISGNHRHSVLATTKSTSSVSRQSSSSSSNRDSRLLNFKLPLSRSKTSLPPISAPITETLTHQKPAFLKPKMKSIKSEADWQDVLKSGGRKLLLRVSY